jgi:hypothetical protein
VTKRGGGVAVNAAWHIISKKELATLFLKFLSCGRARGESFCLDFSCFVLFIKKKNEVGFGAKPLSVQNRFTLLLISGSNILNL